MTKKRIFIFSLVVLIFLAVGSYVLAQPAGTEATLLVTDGDVKVLKSQRFLSFNNQQANLTTGDILIVHQGDTIAVSSVSAAVLTMGDGTSADLFPGTVVQVSELVSDETNFRVRLTLLAGKTVNRVQHLLKADDAYEVQTPSSTASVRGTVFEVDVRSDQETYYRVDEGIVAVKMAEQEVLVEAGFEVTAVVGQPLTVQPQPANASPLATAVNTQTAAQPVSVSAPQTDNAAPEAAADAPLPEDLNEAETRPESASPGAKQDSVSGSDGVVQTAVPVATSPSANTDPDQPSATAASTPGSSSSTSVPPTATRIVPPTATRIVPPTATRVVLPTATRVPPTVTSAPPTHTPVPPTPVPPTPVPPTPIPPTPVPPTSVPPTDTPVPPPPTATPEPAKVTLCHKGNTISVDPSSVQSHLDHGDYLGECHD